MDRLGKVYYINLEHRTDRNEQMIEEFRRIGVSNYERFSAIKYHYGPLGCTRSHLSVFRKIKELNLDTALILEDDAQFVMERSTLDKVVNCFLNDSGCHVLCLGFNIQNHFKYNEVLEYTTNTQTASGYIVKKSILPELIKNFEESESILMKLESIGQLPPYSNNPYALDAYWKKLQVDYKFVIPKNFRGMIQRPSYSDNEQRFVNYGV